MQTKNETKSDSLPPWPSEPPATNDPADVERTSGLVLSVDPRTAVLEAELAQLLRQREADAAQIAKMTADLTRLDDLSRAEKALRESSLVQIRRLAVLEREAEAAKTALAGATAEREALRSRTEQLEGDLRALREAFATAEAAATAAATALAGVTRALEVAAVRPKS
jgi:chromosome segregation ATPase